MCNTGFGQWGETEDGIRNPPHERTSRGYHKYIELILNGASSGVHVLALRKWTFVSVKEKERKNAEVSHSSASASHLYTIQWQEPATNLNKCPLDISAEPIPTPAQMSTIISEFQTYLGLVSTKWKRKQLLQALPRCLSCPFGATLTLDLAQTASSTSIKHQNVPLITLSISNS